MSCGLVAWPGPDPWSIGRQESARSQGFFGVFERILVVFVGSCPTGDFFLLQNAYAVFKRRTATDCKEFQDGKRARVQKAVMLWRVSQVEFSVTELSVAMVGSVVSEPCYCLNARPKPTRSSWLDDLHQKKTGGNQLLSLDASFTFCE